jgi:hypothetical protein
MLKNAFLEKRLDRELESALHEKLTEYLLVGAFPGFWSLRALPSHPDSGETAEEYARALVLREGVPVILVRSGREFVHFLVDGRKSRTVIEQGCAGNGTKGILSGAGAGTVRDRKHD